LITDAFIERVVSKKAVIGVIGLGYVGLPLLTEFTKQGFSAIGFDIDDNKIVSLNKGESYIQSVSSESIQAGLDAGKLDATDDFSRLAEVDAILICVPTPLDAQQEPDLSYVTSTGEAIAQHIRSGQLVVLESTTYPGTTNEVLRDILERDDFKAGEDFFLAYSPEREDPGNQNFSTGTIPKVVGGIDEASLEVAVAMYNQIVVQTVPVSNTETAEAVKLLENIFRSVNIALVNELKHVYDVLGIDVWEVVEAAKTKPFGFMPFYPGPGLGGHCIPIDPFYLTWKAKQHGVNSRFIELAGEVNTAMPEYVINKLSAALAAQDKTLEDSRILVLGAAYKKDVADTRESPGIYIMENLINRGADVSYNDPYIAKLPKQRVRDLQLKSVELTEESLSSCDAVLIATAHSEYDYPFIIQHAQLVLDTRNATHGLPDLDGKIVKA